MDNNKTKLQFTELTPDDITIHENIYIELLMGDKDINIGGGSININKRRIKLMEAKQIFDKTFG